MACRLRNIALSVYHTIYYITNDKLIFSFQISLNFTHEYIKLYVAVSDYLRVVCLEPRSNSIKSPDTHQNAQTLH